jgi:hypothetical protein
MAVTIPMHARKVYSAITAYKLGEIRLLSFYFFYYMRQQYQTLLYS